MSAPAHALAVVGASWGGFKAVGDLVAGLDERCALAVAVAQHRAPDAPADAYVRSIQARSRLPVQEAEDKDVIEPGRVYVAPADYHLLVDRTGLSLSTDDIVQYSRPSIDVLFESAADAFGSQAIGVILTGANTDGAAGLARIRKAGGIGVVQDPATAERREMPNAAISQAGADHVVELSDIGALLCELVGVTE